MPLFRVNSTWEMVGNRILEADDEADALAMADHLPLPTNDSYVVNSHRIDFVEEVE